MKDYSVSNSGALRTPLLVASSSGWEYPQATETISNHFLRLKLAVLLLLFMIFSKKMYLHVKTIIKGIIRLVTAIAVGAHTFSSKTSTHVVK